MNRTYGALPCSAPRLQPYEKPPLRGARTTFTGRSAMVSRGSSGEALSTTTTLTSSICDSGSTQPRRVARLL
jgi:hypothetical protein